AGRERVARNVPTLIADLAQGDPERITAKLVAEAAEQGDVEAQAILNEALDYLGIGMASLVNVFDPQLIVIGGGVTNVGKRFFETVRRGITRHAFQPQARAVRVVPAELGHNVGVMGAAAVALAKTI
ncbi:MAG: ROK family protein, partial [Chloroflexi bacterium]